MQLQLLWTSGGELVDVIMCFAVSEGHKTAWSTAPVRQCLVLLCVQKCGRRVLPQSGRNILNSRTPALEFSVSNCKLLLIEHHHLNVKSLWSL